MLALDPHAQIFSSTEVSLGTPEKGPFAVGEFDTPDSDNAVRQRAFMEVSIVGVGSGRYFVADPVELSDRLNYVPFISDFFTSGILITDPADSTKFLIFRQLHIAYPADSQDAEKLAGSGRFPVVVLVHGQHNWNVPNHMGYLYLQQWLASWGIVSVSVDMNAANALDSKIEMRAEIALKALDAMWDLDAATTSRFHQHLDFQNVGLMGHSRGGDAVVRAAIINADQTARNESNVKRRYGIKVVCSLAPTDFTGVTPHVARVVPTSLAASGLIESPNRLNSNHCPFYAVIYGALDGDVTGMDGPLGEFGTGFRHYDRADTQKSMVFLDRCDHNRFNEVWPDHDQWLLTTDVQRLAWRQTHQDLAKEYIGGLFRWRLRGTTTLKALFDGTATNSLGEKCGIQWSFGQKVTKLDDMENTTPNVGSRSPGATCDDMASKAINVTDNDVYTNHQTRVLVVNATAATPSQDYKLTLPGAQDWTQYEQLTFRVCADANVKLDTTAAASALPDFTLNFDSLGGSAQVTAASLRTANRPRRPVYHKISLGDNCTVICLETLAVDLPRLAGADVHTITSLTLVIPENTVRQFFDSFELVKR